MQPSPASLRYRRGRSADGPTYRRSDPGPGYGTCAAARGAPVVGLDGGEDDLPHRLDGQVGPTDRSRCLLAVATEGIQHPDNVRHPHAQRKSLVGGRFSWQFIAATAPATAALLGGCG